MYRVQGGMFSIVSDWEIVKAKRVPRDVPPLA
jgi:hypothetical protein